MGGALLVAVTIQVFMFGIAGDDAAAAHLPHTCTTDKWSTNFECECVWDGVSGEAICEDENGNTYACTSANGQFFDCTISEESDALNHSGWAWLCYTNDPNCASPGATVFSAGSSPNEPVYFRYAPEGVGSCGSSAFTMGQATTDWLGDARAVPLTLPTEPGDWTFCVLPEGIDGVLSHTQHSDFSTT